jgi:TetR/AcrR family transcriptional repressor of lmrAB and yxaGH operons
MPAVPRHRQPIIHAAVALFRRQGFARTGLNDIVDISGAPKGSLYQYFPLGKSSIVEEAAGCDCRKLGNGMRFNRRIAARTCKSARGLDTDIRISRWLPDHDRAVGTRPRERAVTEAGRKAYAARLAILSRKLVEDGFVKARADALAVLCTSALQGALIQARVERSGRPIEVTARGAGAVAGGGGEAMTWDVLRVRAHNARDNTGLCCYG